MKLEQIKEVLKGYRAPGFSAEITRIAYSGAEDFVFAELPGATPLKITAAVLQQWEIRPFFCIDVTFSGGPGSKMNGQILIPEADWNGKIVSVGNGGPAMTLHYQAELACLYEPYAVIHCDLGTSNIDVGLSSASAVIDHGWRATHLMAVLGKDIVARIYGKPAEHAYFVGMSTGGQQAIASATICPEDFDGIVAIAPAITRSYLHASFVWYTQKLVREDGTPKLTREEIGKIYSKVMEYHARKGYGAPGDAFVSVLFTEQERQEILAELEAGGEFSAEQMEALRALYEGPVNPETGEKVFCGLTMGTEGNMFGIMGHIIPGVFASQLWLGAWINGSLNKEFVGGGYHQFDFAKDVDSPMMPLLVFL